MFKLSYNGTKGEVVAMFFDFLSLAMLPNCHIFDGSNWFQLTKWTFLPNIYIFFNSDDGVKRRIFLRFLVVLKGN